MSYCRFAWQGSEVYIFEAAEGLTCCGCRLLADGFTCQEPEAMIAHLVAHRRAGQFVPEHAITGLWADVPGASRPSRPEPRTLTVSSLMQDLASTEIELLRQHDRLSPEDKKYYPLPIGFKRRLRELKSALAGFERERLKRVKQRKYMIRAQSAEGRA